MPSLKGLFERVDGLYRRVILRDPMAIAIYRWRKDQGDEKLKFNYPLNEKSIIFDIGGYLGNGSAELIKRYNPIVYIFEPIKEYYEEIVQRFKNNPKVKVFNIGLFDATLKAEIGIAEFSSSLYLKAPKMETVQLKNIEEFLNEHNIKSIDLITLNAEGSEYQLLRQMLTTGLLMRCRYLQVQFHQFISQAEFQREELMERIKKTHTLMYSYPFIWESWKRNDTA